MAEGYALNRAKGVFRRNEKFVWSERRNKDNAPIRLKRQCVRRSCVLFQPSPLKLRLLNGFKPSIEKITHGRPWDLPNIEELVVTPYNNPVFPHLVLDLRGEQTPCKSRKRRWNVIIFELVHLPALNLGTGIILCCICG